MDDELAVGLLKKGWTILRTQVNRTGRHVHLVDFGDGSATVAIFQDDLNALVRGQLSRDEIITKNKGADLADPWPVS